MNDTDLETIIRMEQFGGSFVQALANAARRADSKNLRIMKDAWPDYWETYGPDGSFAKK
jgi:hypothetical protein